MTDASSPNLPLPPITEPFLLPFHYGALHTVGIDYLVDPEPAEKILGRVHPRLTSALFDGRACVSINYQLYFAQYAGGSGITEEIEISIIAYPRSEEHRLAALTYADYARGVDQSKLLGIGRIHVLCDNQIAIEAGTKLFAEPKRPARFTAAMPSPNGPEGESWQITCFDADFTADGSIGAPGDPILVLNARLDGLPAAEVNHAPITGYGTEPAGRLLAGSLNVYQPHRLRLLDPDTADRVTVELVDPGAPACVDLAALLDGASAVGVWSVQSPPVAAHNRPYYIPEQS
ncbi:hypothetical protein [Kutzneria sp. CA-103260]|uniref:hypothetical protein n=1 Tax=Kutzneria sp. CA-103260 TaxID=2802641 RepID=UPI001BA62264|nr:hypothetical protein [Kutzneria sp. CA-103260]QUQ67508.1 hypothetical protein JJ691_52430 [Kutzneria sp. CA-103260]